MYTHRVVDAESPAAIGAFAGAVDESVLDAAVAENVAARFDQRVFEVVLADLALEHSLCRELAFMWDRNERS